jgi:hypothetical protein
MPSFIEQLSYHRYLELTSTRPRTDRELRRQLCLLLLGIYDLGQNRTLSPVIRRELTRQLVTVVEELVSTYFHLFDDDELFCIWLIAVRNPALHDEDSEDERDCDSNEDAEDDHETDASTDAWSEEQWCNGACLSEELAIQPDGASNDGTATDEEDYFLVV